MALIKTITTAKLFVRLPHINEESSLPNFVPVEQMVIKPIIGADVLDSLQLQVDANNIVDVELYNLVCSALVPATFLKTLATSHGAMTDAGLRVQSGENMIAAPRWVFKEVQAELEEQASQGIDDLWGWMFANAADYSWTNSNPHKSVFTSGADFANYYHVKQAHRIYDSLRPIIAHVQDHYLYPVVNEAAVDAIKLSTSATAVEYAALDLLKKAVAFLAIAKACVQLPVHIGPHGFTVLSMGSTDTPQDGRAAAAKHAVEALQADAENTGQRYLKQLKQYLDKHASGAVFPLYRNSDQYTDPTTERVDINKNMNGIFAM